MRGAFRLSRRLKRLEARLPLARALGGTQTAAAMNIPKGDYVNVFKPAVTPGVPTPGIHDPSTPYIPSSEKAYGPKGKWNGKSIQDIEYEGQYSRTLSCVGQDGELLPWLARGELAAPEAPRGSVRPAA